MTKQYYSSVLLVVLLFSKYYLLIQKRKMLVGASVCHDGDFVGSSYSSLLYLLLVVSLLRCRWPRWGVCVCVCVCVLARFDHMMDETTPFCFLNNSLVVSSGWRGLRIRHPMIQCNRRCSAGASNSSVKCRRRSLALDKVNNLLTVQITMI
jgi:hypothetical protein